MERRCGWEFGKERLDLCPMQAPLVGAVGQEYVHTVLTSMNPQNAVKEIQKHGAFRNKRCKPVLELLDQLDLKRCSSMQASLLAANSTPCPHFGLQHPLRQYNTGGDAVGMARPRYLTVLYPDKTIAGLPRRVTDAQHLYQTQGRGV